MKDVYKKEWGEDMSCKLCWVAVALSKKWTAWEESPDTHAKFNGKGPHKPC